MRGLEKMERRREEEEECFGEVIRVDVEKQREDR